MGVCIIFAGRRRRHHRPAALVASNTCWEEKEKNFIYYDLNLTLIEEIMGWLINLKEREQ